MKIDLILDGHQVEINKDIDFVLNKQFTELTDLTAIIIDYSKTVKVPMTPHNNEIFNYVYKLEHQVLVGENIINYDPSQKIPMVMNFNGSLVMEGYAVLASVDLKTRMYEINLYGQLGKIFSELKEKTLENYFKDHRFNNGMFSDLTMDRDSVAASFSNAEFNLDWNSDNWTDFFGFAPQLYGATDIIDIKNYEQSGTTMSFAKVMDTTRGVEGAGEFYIGDGLDFNQYGEMRSYLTRPYVYVNKLVQLIQNEINTGNYDGYSMDLDTDWFNEDNPYYRNLCYFPGRETVVDKGKSVSGGVVWNSSERPLTFPADFLPTVSSSSLEDFEYVTSGTTVTIRSTGTDGVGANISLNCDGITVRDRVTGVESFDSSKFNKEGVWAYYNLPDPGIVPIRYIGIYDSEDQLLHKLYLCDDTIRVKDYKVLEQEKRWHRNMWDKLRRADSRNVVPNNAVWVNFGVSNYYCEVRQTYSFGNIVLTTGTFRMKVGCDLVNTATGSVVKANVSTSEWHPLCPFKNDKLTQTGALWDRKGATYSMWFTPIQRLDVTSLTYRSGSTWTIREVLGDDFNPFTWLIDYAKRFRLFFDIDYKTRKITLKSDYFKDVQYRKVTVDYSKGVKVEPIIDLYSEYSYGYADNESIKGRKYRRKYGVNYGDISIDTGIKVNSERMTLCPDEDESMLIPVKTDALYWNNLNSVSNIQYGHILKTDRIISTLNKDNEVEYYPFYCFRVGNYVTNSGAFYRLTDDTPVQRNTGKYTLLSTANTDQTRQMNYIPQFDNYISRSVDVASAIAPSAARMMSRAVIDDEQVPVIDFEEGTVVDGVFDNISEDTVFEYTHPITGDRIVITKPVQPLDPEDPVTPTVPDLPPQIHPYDPEDPDAVIPVYKTFLYWATFGVPAEVYNGNVPSNIESYSVYNRWKNYLNNEIFNIHNKKVTCYVRMSYPEFIDFKFNQLFVIDNSVFLVNKIVDFNPNTSESTLVELLQISDVKNLR